MDITSELRNDLLLKEVGHRIAVMRQRARLTQEDFAAKSGISRSALQRLERGHEGARLLTFLEALRTLGRIEAMGSVVPRDEPTPMELAEAKAARPPKRVRRRRGESADEDMVACAREANLSAARAKAIVGEVRDAVARWLEFADAAEVRSAHARQIADRLSRDS